jgi:hypothetical protein
VYAQAADGGAERPTVIVATNAPDGGNPLERALIDSLDPADPPWSAVTAAATTAVRERHALQAAMMDIARKRHAAARLR